MKKVAISIGDLNGIGIELALKNHAAISKIVKPIYCIDDIMVAQASKLLNIKIPEGFETLQGVGDYFTIKPSQISADSGRYSYDSFVKAVELAKKHKVDAITTLPIHKKAWELAGLNYKGHTDALRDFFDSDAIMMLGCPAMFVALYTEHIPLKEVAAKINTQDLTQFLLNFYQSLKKEIDSSLAFGKRVALLGLNPHAGDDGVLGDEEYIIQEALSKVHSILQKDIFTNPLVPDVAFAPKTRANYQYYIAMYHDQGLIPLKALYFDESINVSLNLPIVRTSVDHGTAFDIAYSDTKINSLSYLNAIKYLQ